MCKRTYLILSSTSLFKFSLIQDRFIVRPPLTHIAGQFRKQFAYLEENGGKSSPVIPLERKHVSLPRSTVHSNVIPPNTQQNLTSYEHRKIMEQASTNFRAMDSCSGNPSKAFRPPPRVPTSKPGRVVGPILPFEDFRNIKDDNGSRFI
ncbi:hypothetical protein CMV_013508 [Castanea mollissima]|uniref:Uncharacterized protein n=1 Tax=Castanea mollissima TaxID=60419 RepID=A0A8J4RES3_9ROSI|nr:hypothetical protein CMV_013508 [Castanea mollissima]